MKLFFTVEAYKKTYTHPIFSSVLMNVTGDAIHSLPAPDLDEKPSASDDDSVLPSYTYCCAVY